MWALLGGLSSKVYMVAISFLVAVVMLLSVSNYFKIKQIEGLQDDIMDVKAQYQQERANNAVLKASISEQNMVIEKNKVDMEKRVKEFEAWKKVPVYKYRTIVKEVKSDECKDIKDMLDSIRKLPD
jgi:hypothetical protein